MEPSHLRLLVRTFCGVFPHVQMWWVPVQRRELMLLGSREGIRPDPTRMEAHLVGWPVPEPLRQVGGDDVVVILSWLVGCDGALRSFAGEGPVEREGLPRLAAAVSWRGWLSRNRVGPGGSLLQALAGLRVRSRGEREALLGGGVSSRGDAFLLRRLRLFDRSWMMVLAGHRAELVGDLQVAAQRYAAALRMNPEDRSALLLLRRSAGSERAAEVLRELRRRGEDRR